MNETQTGSNNIGTTPENTQVATTGVKVVLAEPQGQGEEVEVTRAGFWNTRYTTALTTQTPMHQKWSEYYKQMYAKVDPGDMEAWRSKVFLPILAGKVWDLIARFIQYKPGWEVSIKSMPVAMDNARLQQYLGVMRVKYDKVKLKMDYDYDNYLRETPIQEELQSVMLDATVTGTGIARVPYTTKIVETKEHPTIGDHVDITLEQITTTHEGYNDFEAVNIFNFYIAPASKNLQSAAWIIIKDYVPLSELQGRPNYKNLEKLVPGGVKDDTAQYQASKKGVLADPDEVSLDSSLNLIETFECWDKASKMVTVYANQGGNWVEIFRQPNIYWHGKYPFVAFYVRRKPHYFWGESLFENSESLQAAMNDVFNHYMDQLNMAEGMMAIEEGSSVEPFIVEPGGEFRYRGEAPKQWKFPEPNPAQLSTVMNQIVTAVESATLSNYASGATNSATDQTQGTFGGITRLMEAAAEKIGMMRANFRRSFNQAGDMWLSNTQQFMDKEVAATTTKGGQQTIEVITPADMTGVFNLRVDEGSFEPVSKDELRKNFTDVVANVTAWSASSVEQAARTGDASQAINLDWNGIMIRGLEVYGENFNNFVITQPTTPQADPMGNIIEGEVVEPPMFGLPAGAEADAFSTEPTAPEGVRANESIQPPNGGVASPEELMAFA